MQCSITLDGKTTEFLSHDSSENPDSRLSRAVNEMARAVALQIREVEAFREAVAELGEEVDILGENLAGYQRSLNSIRVDRLGRKARRLARIAEGWGCATVS